LFNKKVSQLKCNSWHKRTGRQAHGLQGRGLQEIIYRKVVDKLICMTDYIQVVTTVARREDAETIARTLVEERLAACVQIIGPVTSIYRWQGKIESAQEWQCWAKSRQDHYDRMEETIRRLHPYTVPEILVMPVSAGGSDYLTWLDDTLGNKE
jgi:periplasmic divalent cation tolerance protein